MKRIELAFLLTCFCFLFIACEHNEFPAPEEPVVYGTGYIVAGETGDRVQVWDFDGFGPHISGSSGSTHIYYHTIDEASATWLSFAATTSSSASGGYASSNLAASGSSVEFAMASIVDSFWICYDLSPDSSIGTIDYANGMSAADCNGQLYFDYVDSIPSPMAFEAGTRLDSGLNWKPGFGVFYQLSSYWYGGDVIYRHQSTYRPWAEHTENQFVAFRFKKGDRYLYGYVELAAGESWVSITRIAMER